MVIKSIGGKKKHGKIQNKMAYGLNKGGIFKGSKMFGVAKKDTKKVGGKKSSMTMSPIMAKCGYKRGKK